jgi:hypothetical protein
MIETDWMTRKEAAAYLGVSVRQLTNLRLPRSYGAGPRSPRYSRADLIAHLERSSTTPGRRKGGPGRPPLASISVEEQIRRQRARLRRH